MSPSLSPAPVANLNMVPPTWFRPGDWAAGRAEPHPRLRTTPVSTHQVVYERQTIRFRYAHTLLFELARFRSLSLVDRTRNRSLVPACARRQPCERQLPSFRRSSRFRRSPRSRFRSPPPRLSNSLWLPAPARLLPSSFLSNALALPHRRRSINERLPTAPRYECVVRACKARCF